MCDHGRAHGAPEGEAAATAVVRLRLDIAYDGAGFSGWAYQPGRRTVASEIESGLRRLFPGAIGLTVAGRTDAGVHAAGQVAHIDVPSQEWQRRGDRALWRLRGILPTDVRITAVEPVSAQFDARFSALSRRYVYRVADTEWGVDPLRRNDTHAHPRPVDIAAMNDAATRLLGEHDFVAFCKRREGATTIRALRRLEWARDAAGVAYCTVVADAFCHSMVRSLVGALLAVGEGRRDAAWIGTLLRRTERSSEVTVAPAHGLTLAEVEYPAEEAELRARQSQTRRLRTLAAADSAETGSDPA